MKTTGCVIVLLSLFCLTTSFQCNNCSTGTLRLDQTKSWIPLKGKTQLRFLDNSNNVVDFQLKVVDTTETAANDCGDFYKYEYIKASLYLNQSRTDSIHFSLASAGWLCMNALSSGNVNLSMCNVFGQTKEGTIAVRKSNYRVGSRSYTEAIVLLSSPGYSNNVDSVIIANNVGIVGFRYGNTSYALQ